MARISTYDLTDVSKMSEFEMNLLISMLMQQVNLKALLPGSDFDVLPEEERIALRTLLKDTISH